MIIYVDLVYTERIYRKQEVANEDIEYETEYPNRFLGRKKKKKKGLQFGLPCRTPQKTWKCDNQEFKRQNLKEVNSSVWG